MRSPVTTVRSNVSRIRDFGGGSGEDVLIGRASRNLENRLDIVTRGAESLDGRQRDVLVGEEPTHPAARRAA